MKLEYRDKYRLWNDLVLGSSDRLFVKTDERPPLGSKMPLEIHVGSLRLPLVVKTEVIGRRGFSRRFDSGVYLWLTEEELDKCRRFLGLQQPIQSQRKARRHARVHHELTIRWRSPALEETSVTKNIAEDGFFVSTPVELSPGSRVSIELLADHEPLPITAEVVWAMEGFAGLKLVEAMPHALSFLRTQIEEVRRTQEEARAAKKLPILVADDDPDILTLLTKSLTDHGFEVFQARNGDDALNIAYQLRPELVVMDILMPRIDGADICKFMRSDAELVDVPVILVSALEESALALVADQFGATDYLTKPVHLSELINMIGDYLRSDR